MKTILRPILFGEIPASPAIVVAILLGAAAVILGGIVPRWFVEPPLAAVSAF